MVEKCWTDSIELLQEEITLHVLSVRKVFNKGELSVNMCLKIWHILDSLGYKVMFEVMFEVKFEVMFEKMFEVIF